MTPQEPCLSVLDVAKILGVSVLTIRRLIKTKKLKAAKVGRRVIVTQAMLEKYLEENPA